VFAVPTGVNCLSHIVHWIVTFEPSAIVYGLVWNVGKKGPATGQGAWVSSGKL